ncbi:hypothetical protein SRB17_88410 [Streptomyces sp. RB17]|uniref:Asp23/Gls24 family envelope stress response protein n=1 Tax=Streptomyces sp. RB17 TaxID=2585197 RepID=UPI001294DF5B|nr:Asp23/Gls24 family envelope stress response protein [Streptomyces sp. RB17]MQY40808.1 hypothetical protein [Streptomyces sp. RB17]
MALEDQHPQTPSTRVPALASLTGDEVLPCGRLLSHAWEQARDAAAETDPHTTSCPHCREAAQGLAALGAATQVLREQQPTGMSAVADRVMAIVRSEVRLGRMLPLNDPALDLQIAESAAAKVLRRAADAVPWAKAVSCRLTPQDQAPGVHVAMTLAATLDQPLPATADVVRRSVIDAADMAIGMAVTDVDVTVIDVLPTEPGGAR